MRAALFRNVPRQSVTAPPEAPLKIRAALPLLLLLSLALSACSSTKAVKPWNPGDTVICPHCGREFTLPEKLGK